MAIFTRRNFFSFTLACLVLSVLLLPLASVKRTNPHGGPGQWQHESWTGSPHVGVCETAAACGDEWVQNGGSCYLASPRMPYPDAERFCWERDSTLVAISSESENRFVAESLCPEGENCWIGLRGDNNRRRHWWVSEEPLNYTQLRTAGNGLFPLFPLSRLADFQVVTISNAPGEISGCGGIRFVDYLVAPAICMLVSAALLILPRPGQRLATAYLVVAFAGNCAWFVARMLMTCIIADPGMYDLLWASAIMLDVSTHTAASLMAIWLIIRRMRLLYPTRILRAAFLLLVLSVGFKLLVTALFIDTSQSLRLLSIPVLILMTNIAVVIGLYCYVSGLIALDLYRTWTFMYREAVSGCNNQNSTTLTEGVRAARLHLFLVLFAIVSGAIRWAAFLTAALELTNTEFAAWTHYFFSWSTVLDSVTNDVCTHALAVMNMDTAVVRASGITKEVAERASQEVEQHRLAVHVLKAAPTSAEQLQQLAALEARARECLAMDPPDSKPFLVLQSAVRVESARIHRLMHCVRLRAMTMPVRYQYLMDLPVKEGNPRQPVPSLFAAGPSPGASANDYLDWLHSEADAARHVLFSQADNLLARFNTTPWPSDLGLATEEFPWTIWASGSKGTPVRKLRKSEVISPGDILIHSPAASHMLERQTGTYCFVLEETPSYVLVHRSWMPSPEEVPREELYTCSGGGVLVPGPVKKKQRCLDKIAADYEGVAPWPAAASLTDICRCMIVLDDPYAMAVLVAHICSSMRVVRVKNRFGEDALEPLPPEALQSMFYTASDPSESKENGSTYHDTNDSQYRDVSINVLVTNPNGVSIVCEIQVTLSNLAILKSADQKLYTLRRMKTSQELRKTFVFSDGCQIGLAHV